MSSPNSSFASNTAPAASTAADATAAPVAIIGAGIAGASLAYALAPHVPVLLLEREAQPGYHATGRSAALFMASYGPPQVRALSMASEAFLREPPAGFSDGPLLGPRGALMVAAPEQLAQLDAHWAVMQAQSPRSRRLSAAEVLQCVPVLRAERVAAGLLEPDAADMDVHAIHQGYLRGARRHGAQLVCDAEVLGLQRSSSGWQVHTGAGTFAARVVVNAAGAWADRVGALAGAQAIGLQPCRRSAMTFAAPEGVDTRHWPMVIGVDEDWYIKPDAGVLLGSPANADPVEPHDVVAEELDIALAIDRIEHNTQLRIRRPLRTWAGLRSFVADGGLVGGFDPDVPGFFWLAAQGGYGIQTSPAMGQACAAFVRGGPIPAELARHGVSAQALSVQRLRSASLANSGGRADGNP